MLALALLAYVVSAVLAKPELMPVLLGTFLPKIEFSREYLSILVAIIGTTLSAYLYTWQSNQEGEEEIAKGRTTRQQRQGATQAELRRSRHDILIGMTCS
ncbi:divalent metal cation transporter, partial [Mesorhizobium sp. M1C.F.Ca.ET.204.01.1.1]|uniref:divalent metal cation transporter n=1 Tax=Mesorhizobium sp. M1C.F.Ca.ET.204.01.1.1 TaxID=2563929 RepID=UPI001FE11E6F